MAVRLRFDPWRFPVLESAPLSITWSQPVYKKLLFAMVLVLNHSLMFGVTEAAHIPDAEHPYGHTVNYDHGDDSDQDVDGEQHHKHGMHVHLGCALSYSLNFSVQTVPDQALSSCKFLHQSLSYTPPVPPPNY